MSVESKRMLKILAGGITSVRRDLSTTTESMNRRFHFYEQDMEVMKQRHIEQDPCEIKFKGIPVPAPEQYDATIATVLKAIGCPRTVTQIIDIRVWDYKPRTDSRARTGAQARENIPALVAKFSSHVVRDFVMSRKTALRDKTVHDIFGVGPKAPIYLESITTPSLHQLKLDALAVCREYRLPGPLVRGNSVLLRKSANTPLVPIFSGRDLDAFSSTCNQPTPMDTRGGHTTD